MTRKTNAKNLGNALIRDKQKQMEKMKREAATLQGITDQFGKTGGSVLEQTNLDELITTVELRQEAWDDEMGEAEFVSGPVEVVLGLDTKAEQIASDRRQLMSIPRRPQWHSEMSSDELKALEAEAFMDWRRDLAMTIEAEGLLTTPYEKNLDFWRQLWRCMERSDLLVQIVDARDIDFYFSRDMACYVEEMGGRRMVLLANKADFLSNEQRQRWSAYFESKGIDAIFFSGLRELLRQEKQQVEVRGLRERMGEAQATVASWRGASDSAGASVKERVARIEAAEAVAPQDETQPVVNDFTEVQEVRDWVPDPLDGTEVPVPGLNDSDDDLKEEGEDDPKPMQNGHGPEDKQETATDNADANEDEDAVAPVLGDLAIDDKAVADAGMLIELLCARLSNPKGDSNHRGTIGFVGYPNVGKSTVINALLGSRKVAMSKRPGKTKHIQTMDVPELGITLCDCPGLVMPTVAATRAHLVINNTVPLDDLREIFSPISIILDKFGFDNILKRYDCAEKVADARKRSGDHVLNDTHAFLAALAVKRLHFLRAGVPDENWAARKVLKDYVSGALLHVEEPPGFVREPSAAQSSSAQAEKPAADSQEQATEGGEEDDDDFDDIGDFLQEQKQQGKQKNMTKRKMRFLQKHMIRKGVPVEVAGGYTYSAQAAHSR